MAWLDDVLDHALNSAMEIPKRGDDAALLETALEEGFPPEQSLLLTTDTVDKRRSLYRLMEERAVVVDFSVATGTSRKDRSQQDTVLRALVQETLCANDPEPGNCLVTVSSKIEDQKHDELYFRRQAAGLKIQNTNFSQAL